MIRPDLSIRVFDSKVANDANFFKGVHNFKTLDFDPLVTGYAFIFWTKVPAWVLSNFPYFKQLTQKNFKGFGGLTDMELQTGAHSYGFNANEYHVATNLQKQNTDFTIKHAEYSGSPIKNMYQLWITGIRDPQTGVATYPKLYNTDYAAKNHTGEIMYVVTRPDADNVGKKNIEFAAYWTNVLPTKIPLQHLNFELGQHDIQDLEISFKGIMHISPKVDQFADELLATAYGFSYQGEFDPKNAAQGGPSTAGGSHNIEGVTGGAGQAVPQFAG